MPIITPRFIRLRSVVLYGATIALSPLLVGALYAQAVSGDAAYARVVTAWASQSTLEAKFDQRIVNPILGRTVTSRGVFLQQRPGRIAVTFSDPDGDRIVSDGKHLWVYLPSSTPGQVLKLPADAEGAVVPDLLGALFDAPRRTFTISGGEAATIDGQKTRRVVLVPRVASSVPFQRATVWIDDQDPRPVRVQLLDEQGVERTITLTSWSPNAALPVNAFTFIPPKGVKVVTKIPGSR